VYGLFEFHEAEKAIGIPHTSVYMCVFMYEYECIECIECMSRMYCFNVWHIWLYEYNETSYHNSLVYSLS